MGSKAGRVNVVGVHPVAAKEPVHLVEIEVAGPVELFDFGKVTQEMPNQPSRNWQVAWDEREVESKTGKPRFAFFFHYLDLDKPLRTPFGPVKLPAETAIPKHLQDIEYEEP